MTINVLVTGTPGTGKSTFCSELAQRASMQCIDISQLVVDQNLSGSRDEARNCLVIDEDMVCDTLEDESGIDIASGGKIIDYHACDFFPERYFQLVVVLRTDNTVLWDRLQARGYTESKIQENVQAEIMQVVLEDARESYKQEIILELVNNTPDEMESNLELVCGRIASLT
eukprot:m.72682 g.72682  ORF g.72682 m.72682 type:complete len:171 (-) comp12346_c0_seq2:846-1358(-)